MQDIKEITIDEQTQQLADEYERKFMAKFPERYSEMATLMVKVAKNAYIDGLLMQKLIIHNETLTNKEN